MVLDVNDVGGSLYLELSGSTQLDFAEVVFSDGYARVVDFRQRTHRPGFYELMDFRRPGPGGLRAAGGAGQDAERAHRRRDGALSFLR